MGIIVETTHTHTPSYLSGYGGAPISDARHDNYDLLFSSLPHCQVDTQLSRESHLAATHRSVGKKRANDDDDWFPVMNHLLGLEKQLTLLILHVVVVYL